MTASADFDAERYKAATRQQWDNVAEAWDRWGPKIQEWLQDVTETMLDLARIGPGDRVLDLAGGAGEPALSAVDRVGPTGYVLSTDFSANLVRLAAANGRARGLGPDRFEARVMDGENPDLPDASFDAVLSRLGLIFFPNRARALSEVTRVLRPGGRVVLASFTTPPANPFFSIPIGIIRRRARLPPPPPGGPGPFGLGDPAALTEALHQAGFSEVVTRHVAVPLRFPSSAECLRFEQECFGALHEMLANVSDAERAAAWAEIREQLQTLDGPTGFQSPAEILVGAATR